MFINRKEEEELARILDSDRFEFVILYGRRRIGKTTLIKKIIDERNGFYYLGLDVNKKEQLKRLKNKLGTHFKNKILEKVDIGTYDELFEIILNYDNFEEKQIIVFDEFQYFFYKEKGVLSEFQYIIDELLKNTKIKIVVLGSSISMIENNILSYRSPLYGRKTSVFDMKTFSILEFYKLFPNYNLSELIEIYSVVNGIPYYSDFLDKNISPVENIKKFVLKNGGIFIDEVNSILKYEISEFRTYFLILSYISTGANKFSEISSKTGLDKSNLTRYLMTLQDISIVKKETPILENSLKSKKSLYKIDDLFVNFWFYYIWGNRDLIEFDITKIHKIFDDTFSYYVSSSLDKIIYDYIRLKVKLNFSIFKIGRQWDKNYEFDICAFDYERENILLGEIKWTNKKIDNSVLLKLQEKSKYLKDFEKIVFILVSKNGFTKDVLEQESENLILLNLSQTYLEE